MGLGGGGKSQSTETSVRLAPEQRELISLATPFLREFAEKPPTAPTTSGIAGFDPLQTEAQQQALGARGAQQQIADQALASSDFLSTAARDIQSNPFLQGAFEAAVRPINEQLSQVALPNVRSEFDTVGAFGGTRQGIAEGLAIQGAQQTAGDITSRIGSEAFGQSLDAQIKALGLAPQTGQLQLQPAATTSAVGDVLQNFQQQLLSEQIGQEQLAQNFPLLIGREILGASGLIPSAGATSTAFAPSGGSGVGGALSGAAGGAALGTAIAPGIGTGIGAGAGLLLSLLQ